MSLQCGPHAHVASSAVLQRPGATTPSPPVSSGSFFIDDRLRKRCEVLHAWCGTPLARTCSLNRPMQARPVAPRHLGKVYSQHSGTCSQRRGVRVSSHLTTGDERQRVCRRMGGWQSSFLPARQLRPGALPSLLLAGAKGWLVPAYSVRHRASRARRCLRLLMKSRRCEAWA